MSEAVARRAELGVGYRSAQSTQIVGSCKRTLAVVDDVMVHIVVRRCRNGPCERDIILSCCHSIVGYRFGSCAVAHLQGLGCIYVARSVKTSVLFVIAETVEVVDRCLKLRAQARTYKCRAAILRKYKSSNTRYVRCSHRCSFQIAVAIAWQGRKHTTRLTIVEQSARSDDVGPCSKVGVACRHQLIGHCCYGKHFVVACGVVVACRTHVTGCKDTQATGHVVGARCLGEIIYGVEHGLLTVAGLAPSPRTLGDGGTTLCGIHYRCGKITARCA